jgi:hypothetical protein
LYEPTLSDGDIAEKHEEERLLLQDLEDLVSGFEQKYMELCTSLLDFLHGYWATRMREALYGRQIPDIRIASEAYVATIIRCTHGLNLDR